MKTPMRLQRLRPPGRCQPAQTRLGIASDTPERYRYHLAKRVVMDCSDAPRTWQKVSGGSLRFEA